MNWYVAHTLSGQEMRVKANIDNRVRVMKLEDKFGEVMVPSESITEVRGGKKHVTTRKIFPGYVFIEMELNEGTWHLVRNTPGVSGFVGSGMKPTALRSEEIKNILKQIEEKKAKPKPKVEFEKGEAVKVIDGPFANFVGIVDELSPEKGRLTVMVSIFGRQTAVEFEYWQVEKT